MEKIPGNSIISDSSPAYTIENIDENECESVCLEAETCQVVVYRTEVPKCYIYETTEYTLSESSHFITWKKKTNTTTGN